MAELADAADSKSILTGVHQTAPRCETPQTLLDTAILLVGARTEAHLTARIASRTDTRTDTVGDAFLEFSDCFRFQYSTRSQLT